MLMHAVYCCAPCLLVPMLKSSVLQNVSMLAHRVFKDAAKVSEIFMMDSPSSVDTLILDFQPWELEVCVPIRRGQQTSKDQC